jgi:hypothetical protein
MGIRHIDGKGTWGLMAVQVFDNILNKASAQGISSNAADARTWFRNQASKVSADPNKLMNEDKTRQVKKPTLGNMYLFRYDPKLKNVLPYYDTFPLIFPFKSTTVTGLAGTKKGFMGINLHYLPLVLRAKLMDALYQVSTNPKNSDIQKMRLSYRILTGTSKIRYYEPCIKQYLFDHVRSSFFEISPKEWNMALFMPLERFVGASKQQVWKDSKRIIGA